MSDTILEQSDGRVFRIWLNRAHKKNALNTDMYDAFAAALSKASKDPDIRVVMIAAKGDAFCAGNDIFDFLSAPPDPTDEDGSATVRFMKALSRFDKPVIAAVDGLAVGIGATLLLHCDLVYATDSATFTLPFVSLGLTPEFGSSRLLVEMAGRAKASEMLLLGETISAARACELGMVTRVFPTEELEQQVEDRLQRIVSLPPGALRQTRALMLSRNDKIHDHIILENKNFLNLLRGEEFQEAATAFVEKRPPDFSKFN